MPSTALVHEWLVRWGGSESVLASLSSILPRAPIYTLLHHPDERVKASFGGREVIATPLSRIPGAGSIYPAMLPLMPEVWRRTRVPASEFIVSSSHAFCKSIDAGNAIHVCYCHTPPRYIWDLVDEYQPASVRRLSAPLLQHLRRRDLEAAQRVDHFVANSRFVAARIRRLYGRESRVVYPPVDVDRFVPEDRPRTHFLAGGRLVRYKRIDRAIEARSSSDIVRDNAIVIDVNKVMADLGTIKASTEIYEQRLLVTGLFSDAETYKKFETGVRKVEGIKNLYWHVTYMTDDAKEDAIKAGRMMDWTNMLAFETKASARLIGTAGVADVNFRVTGDPYGNLYLLGRARSREELKKAVAKLKEGDGVQKVYNYAMVRP